MIKKVASVVVAGLLAGCTNPSVETKQFAETVNPDYDGDGVVRVLAIGNSFSICLQSYWPKIADAYGTKLDLCTLYIGGCSLETHAKNIEKLQTDPSYKPYRVNRTNCMKKYPRTMLNIPAALQLEAWDVVTIQQASHESWREESFHPWVDQVIETIRKYAPQAEIRIQETWSYSTRDKRIYSEETGGAGKWGFDQTGMYERLHANYAALGKQYGFSIIPVGTTVQRFRSMLPLSKENEADDVVGSDGDTIHLNAWGEYLQALVWQKAFFGSDPMRCTYAPPLFKKTPDRLFFIREVVAK